MKVNNNIKKTSFGELSENIVKTEEFCKIPDGKTCDFCNSIIKSKKHRHFNVEQKHKIHYFCNKDCKLSFIYLLQSEDL